MKNIIRLIVILLILMSTSGLNKLFSQEQLSKIFCSTIERTDEEMEYLPWYGKNEYLYNLKDSIEQVLRKELPGESRGRESCSDIEKPLAVPIRFFIYQENGSDPGVPDARDLQEMMDALNNYFQNCGMSIRFYMKCPMFITDPDALSLSDWEAYWHNEALQDPSAVNIHITDDYTGGFGVYNGFGDFIVIQRDVYQDSDFYSTLAHEIGHYFGLEHTHRNSGKGKCRQEPVSRTRIYAAWWCSNPTIPSCAIKGDALCDTPADPNLSGKVSNSCSYLLSENDNWDDSYTHFKTFKF